MQARAFLAACHAELGTFAEGNVLGEEGLQIAEDVKHPSSLMWAQYGIGLLALRQGHLPRALSRLQQAMGIGQETNLALFVPRMAAALGEAYALDGRAADAAPLLAQAVERTTAPEMIGFQVLCRLPLGEGHLMAGRLDAARAEADRALALARTHQERAQEAYALRLLGEVAAQREPPHARDAEARYTDAIELAHQLGMRPLVAHCHLGLGKLYRRTGKREQSREHLATATAMYGQMHMSFWPEQVEAELGR